MGQVYFYHLTDSPLEAALPMLLERARQAGWNILLRGADEDRLDWIDQKLWLLGDESFLPHGQSGGPHDAMQPILLSLDADISANNAACLMAFDGAAVSTDEVQAVERACILFDGNDPDAVQKARDQWKLLGAGGCTAQYWAQDGGRWSKKAESGGEGA